MHWIEKLKSKWSLKSTGQVVIVLIIFSLTGFSILFLKRPVLAFVTDDGSRGWVFYVLSYLIILPLYNVLILMYGFLFGQFSFFWNYQLKLYGRLFGRRKNDPSKE